MAKSNRFSKAAESESNVHEIQNYMVRTQLNSLRVRVLTKSCPFHLYCQLQSDAFVTVATPDIFKQTIAGSILIIWLW